jgi:putative methyltransferase (TIGR04325 family)
LRNEPERVPISLQKCIHLRQHKSIVYGELYEKTQYCVDEREHPLSRANILHVELPDSGSIEVKMNILRTVRSLVKPLLPRAIVEYLRPSPPPTLFLTSESGIPDYPSGMWQSPEWFSYCREKLAAAKAPRGHIDYLDCLTCALVASRRSELRVTDWGGGTGFIYHVVRNRLPHDIRLKWTVVDSEHVMSIGRSDPGGELMFASNAPDADILLINTSLQYVDLGLLRDLLLKSSYEMVVMTRLLVSSGAQVVAQQVFFDRYRETCRFHARDDVVSVMKNAGFELALAVPNFDESEGMKSALSTALKSALGTQTISEDLYFRRPEVA